MRCPCQHHGQHTVDFIGADVDDWSRSDHHLVIGSFETFELRLLGGRGADFLSDLCQILFAEGFCRRLGHTFVVAEFGKQYRSDAIVCSDDRRWQSLLTRFHQSVIDSLPGGALLEQMANHARQARNLRVSV